MIASLWLPRHGTRHRLTRLFLGEAAIFAARESESRPIRGFTLSSLVLMALFLLASLIHLDRFTAEPVIWVWFAGLGVGLCALAAVLYTERNAAWPGPQEVATR